MTGEITQAIDALQYYFEYIVGLRTRVPPDAYLEKVLTDLKALKARVPEFPDTDTDAYEQINRISAYQGSCTKLLQEAIE